MPILLHADMARVLNLGIETLIFFLFPPPEVADPMLPHVRQDGWMGMGARHCRSFARGVGWLHTRREGCKPAKF